MQNEQERARLIRETSKRVMQEMARRGKILEGGWKAFVTVAQLEKAPPNQLHDMREAYYGGAQHLWASMMNMFDPQGEVTEADMNKMDLIKTELDNWVKEHKPDRN